jgi:hypothetical protein
VRLDERRIVIEKRFLRPLVEKLEAERWLRLERTRLLRELKLTTGLTESLRKETALQKQLTLRLKKSLSLARMRLKNANKRIAALERDSTDYREMRMQAERLDEAREKEIKTMRRRLAGQKIAIWTVSAVGGALIMLLLL